MRVREGVLEALKKFQLRPTSFSALVIIKENPGMSQSELANALDIKRSGVVLLVDDLEQMELIARHTVPEDRRSYALHTTLKGIQVVDKAIKSVEACEAEIFKNLTSQECALLKSLFQQINHSEEQQTIA